MQSNKDKEVEKIISTSAQVRGMIWIPKEVKQLIDLQNDDKVLWILRGTEVLIRNNRQGARPIKIS